MRASDPDISVLLCTFNRAAYVGDVLDSLVAQETGDRFTFEIVVVDNASSDGTARVVQDRASASRVPIRYFVESHPGVSYARNRSVREARGGLLAFIDDDELAEPTWLAELYDARRVSGAPIVGGAVRLDLPDDQLHALGTECRRCLRETDVGRYGDRVTRCPPRLILGTCNLLVEKQIFDQIGDFDHALFMGGEDTDFQIRARRAGFDQWYTPKAVVFHRVPIRRFEPDSLRNDSFRSGAMIAFLSRRHRGLLPMIAETVARVGQAAMVTIPRLVWAQLTGDSVERLDRQIKWWRMTSFVHTAARLTAPWCDMEPTRDRLDFRRGRDGAS